jgi:hypothetical protein
MNDCGYGFFHPRFTANFGVSLAPMTMSRMKEATPGRDIGALQLVAIIINPTVCERRVRPAQYHKSLGGSL